MNQLRVVWRFGKGRGPLFDPLSRTKHLLWNKCALKWMARITQLIENQKLREEMGKQGREFAREFDVSVIGTRLTDLILNCLSGK